MKSTTFLFGIALLFLPVGVNERVQASGAPAGDPQRTARVPQSPIAIDAGRTGAGSHGGLPPHHPRGVSAIPWLRQWS